MNIPIQNIYYMLCYSWDALDQLQNIPTRAVSSPDLYELIGWVLCGSVRTLEFTGLDRGYQCAGQSTMRPSGKIVFSESINPTVLMRSHLFCETDELTTNLIHNQILKTTLYRLKNRKAISIELRNELTTLLDLFNQIELIEIQAGHFHRMMFDRNNSRYRFIMKLCEMLFMKQLPVDIHGNYEFPDYLRDSRDLARLFQNFVKQFFKTHLKSYEVTSNYLYWNASADEESHLQFLPRMETDISLRSEKRNLVIDTKFYQETLNGDKIHPSNLYQILAYLNSREYSNDPRWEGLLLYPTIKENLNLTYQIQGRRVRICTVDLNREWQLIHNDLIALVS